MNLLNKTSVFHQNDWFDLTTQLRSVKMLCFTKQKAIFNNKTSFTKQHSNCLPKCVVLLSKNTIFYQDAWFYFAKQLLSTKNSCFIKQNHYFLQKCVVLLSNTTIFYQSRCPSRALAPQRPAGQQATHPTQSKGGRRGQGGHRASSQ